MSDMLMLSMNTALLPRPLSSKIDCISPSSHSQIKGKMIEEVQVIKTNTTYLPIPIKLPTHRSPDGSRTLRQAKSPFASPVVTPRSMYSSKTLLLSSKSLKQNLRKCQNFCEKIRTDHSPRQDIGEILKNSLKLEKTQQKIKESKIKQEIKMKLDKKLQLKVLDELIREKNFNKFKQKFPVSRPRWGADDKKVISDTKALRDLERHKKKHKKLKKSTFTYEVFNSPNKKKIRKVKKEEMVEKRLESPEEISEKKKQIFQKIKNLADRVEQLRIGAKDPNEKAISGLVKSLEKYIKRWFFNKLLYLTSSSSSSISSSEAEDKEARYIMRHKNRNPQEAKTRDSKSQEKLLESQIKIKQKQQEQLTDLKAKDLQEMNKLAEVLGNNPEMKKKFESMIERRYSKLEHFFQENIKQILGLEGVKIEEEKSNGYLPQYTVSEFSSSFLMQLDGVPAVREMNLTIENLDNDKEELVDSPSSSLYSRDTSSEPEYQNISFPGLKHINSHPSSQDEPSFPLISESLVHEPDVKQQNSVDSIEQLVGGIDCSKFDLNNSSENTLDLKNPGIHTKNPMFILEDSGGDCDSNANFSSISEEFKEDTLNSESKSKTGRVIMEKFPSPFPDLPQSSIELEGFELCINIVIYTLEKDVFNYIYQEIQNDEKFWTDIQKKPSIAVRMSLSEFENQVQTDSIAVLSIFKKLQGVKDSKEVMEALLVSYNPLIMLRRIEENFFDDDDNQIFNYCDIEKLEKTSNISSFSSSFLSEKTGKNEKSLKNENFYSKKNNLTSSSCINPYKMTHHKMIIDSINEALLKSAKKKVNMPWKLQEQPLMLDYDTVFSSSYKKIMKWSQVEAGKIPTSELLNGLGNLDEEKLQVIRQDKLAKLLIFDVAEADKSWTECDVEETQISFEISEFIMNILCRETANIIRNMIIKE